MSYSFSASQIKDFLRCERAWWTKSVAYAPDDPTAGGQYLIAGRMFDELVGLRGIGMPFDDAEVIARSVRESRGVGLDAPKLVRLYQRALRQLRVAESLKLLPEPRTAAVQHKYRVPVPGLPDVFISGKTDLRRPGHVWDTKTTSDRGQGQGPDKDTPPNALTAETMAQDVQVALYAWAEFQLDPSLQWCKCVWVYVTKTDSPSAWSVEHTFTRRESHEWFESVVRPVLVRMVGLKGVRGQYSVAANHDGCQRCFVKLSCNPYEGLQSSQEGNLVMAFDLNKLKREQSSVPDPVSAAPAEDTSLVRALEASVAINRPRPEPAPVIETTGVELVVDPEPAEVPAVVAREEMAAAIEAQALSEANARPKARRGRPRGSKNAVSAVSSESSAPVTGASTASKALYEEAEALATAVQTALDGLDSARGRFTKTLEELDKRIATLRAGL